MYYGHSSWIAIVIFGGMFALRYFSSQRRRGRSPGYRNSFTGTYRPGRPTAPPAGPVDSPVPPPEAPTSSHPASDRPTSSGLAPGWFTDPFVRHEQRYWSGNGWTEHVTDDGAPGIDPPDTARGPDRPAD